MFLSQETKNFEVMLIEKIPLLKSSYYEFTFI